MEPPLVAPAPTMVWISSMNSTACGIVSRSAMTAFRRASKSPRNLVPAQQPAHVQREDAQIRERGRHVAQLDQARQPLGDRGFAHAGVADQDRVVLVAPAQDLLHARQLLRAADQRIDLPRLARRLRSVAYRASAFGSRPRRVVPACSSCR